MIWYMLEIFKGLCSNNNFIKIKQELSTTVHIFMDKVKFPEVGF